MFAAFFFSFLLFFFGLCAFFLWPFFAFLTSDPFLFFCLIFLAFFFLSLFGEEFFFSSLFLGSAALTFLRLVATSEFRGPGLSPASSIAFSSESPAALVAKRPKASRQQHAPNKRCITSQRLDEKRRRRVLVSARLPTPH